MLKKILDIPKKVQIQPPAREFLLQGKDNMPAILLVHGFSGSPYDLRYLAEQLHGEGYTVRVPRLPGHGTTKEDFLASSHVEWYRKIFDEMMTLKEQYDQLWLGGLSMGALIAILISYQFNINKLILAAPALVLKKGGFGSFIALAPLVGQIIASIPGEPEVDLVASQEVQTLQQEYGSRTWIKQAGYLRKLQIKARKTLKKLDSKILAIYSDADLTVDPSVIKFIKKNVSASRLEILHLKDSPHVVTNGCDRKLVADECIKWLRSQ